MRKILVMLFVALIAITATSTALADVSIGAWGRGFLIPVISDQQGEISPARTTSWGDDAAKQRIGFSVVGDSQFIGFQVDLTADNAFRTSGSTLGFGDQVKVWVQPFDMITFSLGPSIHWDRFRGNTVFGNWDWLRTNGSMGEDVTFRRLAVTDGATVVIDPMPNMAIWAGWGDTAPEWAGDEYGIEYVRDVEVLRDDEGAVLSETAIPNNTGHMLKNGQYGVGYDIAGIGTARAQYIGAVYINEDGDHEDFITLNAAFRMDGVVRSLSVDLGVYYCLDDDARKSGDVARYPDQVNHRVALYSRYDMNPMVFHALFSATFDKPDLDGNETTALHAAVGMDYSMLIGWTVVSDIRWSNEAQAEHFEGGAIDLLVGAEKGFTNGKFGIGAQVTTGGFEAAKDQEDPDDLVFALPIKVEYWF